MAPTTVSEDGWTIIKVTIVLMVLDIIVVALRLVARKRSEASFGADDAWAVIAVIFLMGNVAADYWSIFSGAVGWPLPDFSSAQLEVYYKADYVSSFLNLANVVAVRFSVLCLYRRIFTTPTFRRVTLGLGIIIIIHALLLMIAAAFRCIPIASIWDQSIQPTMCINYATGFLAGMTLNALIDAALLCLPLIMIRGLHMQRERKLALAGIFLLGAGTCIAAILRVALVYSQNTADFNRTKLIIWSNTETGVGLICACLPTFRPLFPASFKLFSSLRTRLSGKLSTSSHSSSGIGGSDSNNRASGGEFGSNFRFGRREWEEIELKGKGSGGGGGRGVWEGREIGRSVTVTGGWVEGDREKEREGLGRVEEEEEDGRGMKGIRVQREVDVV